MTVPESITSQLDAAYAAWLTASNPPLPEGFTPTLQQMREGFASQASISNTPAVEELEVQDITVPGRHGHILTLRWYRHRNSGAESPCCVYVHGGGWVLGNLDTHDGICADIAIQTRQSVVAIDYRLSPEHQFPAAIEDTIDVLQLLQFAADSYGIDARRISLTGDSAGASIALSACLQLRESSALPGRLALIYPAVGADIDRPSFVENRSVPGLHADLMRFFFMSYIGGEVLPDPLAAPLLVEDLGALPPVFISGAQFDPLRDDASDLALRLNQAGVDTQLRIEPKLGHGYLWVRRQSPQAAAAFTAMTQFLSQDRR